MPELVHPFVILGPREMADLMSGQPPQHQSLRSAQDRPSDQPAPGQTPPVAGTATPERTEEEKIQDARERHRKARNDALLVGFNALLALFTLVLATSTIFLWWETRGLRKSADAQTEDMKRSIAEATRAATAMEGVSESMATNVWALKESVAMTKEIADRQKIVTELEMRAFISVATGGVVPQDAQTGYRFEPRMLMINNGNTPAYNVSYQARADVLPFPLPKDFDYSLANSPPSGSFGVLGPRQNFIMSAVVPQLYSDAEANEIREGVKRRVYVWGRITYEDAFGINRYVDFAQSFAWFKNGAVMGFNTPQHNESN